MSNKLHYHLQLHRHPTKQMFITHPAPLLHSQPLPILYKAVLTGKLLGVQKLYTFETQGAQLKNFVHPKAKLSNPEPNPSPI